VAGGAACGVVSTGAARGGGVSSSIDAASTQS
jgi:hypothetical protein